MDVQVFADRVARFDICELGGILVCVMVSSFLFECTKAHHFGGLHLFTFGGMVLWSGT